MTSVDRSGSMIADPVLSDMTVMNDCEEDGNTVVWYAVTAFCPNREKFVWTITFVRGPAGLQMGERLFIHR